MQVAFKTIIEILVICTTSFVPLFLMLKNDTNSNNFRFAKKALHAANAGFAGLVILDDQVDTRISNIASASKNWSFLNLNMGFLPCQDFSTNMMFVCEKVELPGGAIHQLIQPVSHHLK